MSKTSIFIRKKKEKIDDGKLQSRNRIKGRMKERRWQTVTAKRVSNRNVRAVGVSHGPSNTTSER